MDNNTNYKIKYYKYKLKYNKLLDKSNISSSQENIIPLIETQQSNNILNKVNKKKSEQNSNEKNNKFKNLLKSDSFKLYIKNLLKKFNKFEIKNTEKIFKVPLLEVLPADIIQTKIKDGNFIFIYDDYDKDSDFINRIKIGDILIFSDGYILVCVDKNSKKYKNINNIENRYLIKDCSYNKKCIFYKINYNQSINNNESKNVELLLDEKQKFNKEFKINKFNF